MAPGGLVVVWLSGPGHQVDIGAFQAHDTIIDMSAFVDILGHSHTKQNDNQDIFVDLEMKRNPISAANIKAHGIPYGLWEKYRQKFNYKPVIKFDQLEKIETTNIFMEFYNAEVESYNSANIYMDTFSMRAIIKQINLIWIGNWAGKKQKYSVIIEMDEPEIKQAFDEVYGKYYNEHAELLIEVNRGNDQYRIFLEGNGKKVELKNFKGDIMLGGK